MNGFLKKKFISVIGIFLQQKKNNIYFRQFCNSSSGTLKFFFSDHLTMKTYGWFISFCIFFNHLNQLHSSRQQGPQHQRLQHCSQVQPTVRSIWQLKDAREEIVIRKTNFFKLHFLFNFNENSSFYGLFSKEFIF